MIRVLRGLVAVFAAGLERTAVELSEAAKGYPRREFYRGYQQGVRDGLDGAEHAKKWLQTKETR